MSAAFGLYGASSFGAGTRIGAGASFTLAAPVFDAGVPVFRHSLWLPLPDGLAAAHSLTLGAGALTLRFAPLRLTVGTGSSDWFVSARPDGSTVRLTMTLPAPVLQFRRPLTSSQYEIALKRADGDAVADKAAANGRTNADLAEPWVGADVVVALGALVPGDLLRRTQGPKVFASNGLASAAAPVGLSEAGFDSDIAHAAVSLSVISQVVIGGTPASPRMKLWAEPAGGAPTLLWQELLAGPQGSVDLPAEPLTKAWAPALAQVLAQRPQADPAVTPPPVRLRLDLESDLPCSVTLSALELALDAGFELLGSPARFDFDGTRAASAALPLALPVGGAAQSLALAGRVIADAAASADPGSDPAGGREGALAGPETRLQQPLDLSQPTALAGVAIAWQPLSDTVRGQWRLLADGGSGPAAAVLAGAPLDLPTPAGGWLALRFATVDLQPRRVWLELALSAGSGLWLFADGGGRGRAGGSELPRALAAQPLAGGAAVAGPVRPIAIAVGSVPVAAALATGALSIDLAAPALAALATSPLDISSGVAASVTFDSALVQLRLP